MRLTGKTAFVTAAGAGIGRATALAFAAEGANVIATDIDADALAALEGGRIQTRRLDVRNADAIAATAGPVRAVDNVFNCAGFVHHGTILECDEAAFDFSMALNVKANYAVTRALLPGIGESELRARTGAPIAFAPDCVDLVAPDPA